MKLGVHVSLWTPRWTSPFLDALDQAADLGFTCVEIPLMDPFDFPLEAVRARLQARQLDVYCGTGLGADTDIGSDSAAVREQGIAHLTECLRICAALGSDSLGGVIHSPWGMRRKPDPGYTDRVATSLATVADRAAASGISLGLECINRYENSFLNTVEQGLGLLERIRRSNVGLHLDTYHLTIEERSIFAAIRAARGRILRMHLSENTRGYPGSGALAWRRILKSAMDAGYFGPWIIESYIDPDLETSADVCIWRQIEADTSASLRTSLGFLDHLLASFNGRREGSG